LRERLEYLRRIKPQIAACPVERNDAAGHKPMDGPRVATQPMSCLLRVACPRWG
jgi:hypothetical protein